ncbi:MAG: type II toxin-antitoxin system HipA family toxin [Lachnospiraceae bacterium]|nr:type II toxin-antitoxin system HipA family toxin [Lachnospiraceae bacterium]
MKLEKTIYVYADWLPYRNTFIGRLYASQTRGRELFAFEYDEQWIAQASTFLDPDLMLYRGRHYLPEEKDLFGIFSDSCPDRWGRLLMKRREAIRARKVAEKPRKLLESNYLLGVHDMARMGGLRFKIDPNEEFVSSNQELAAPPWTTLRELETASISFEHDQSGLEEKWLNQLLAPGSSLGGARPKATVMAPDGALWIAKFPSKNDEWNTGAWEMVTHDLAEACGLNVPEAKLETFSKTGSTYLVKRFDRDGSQRIHFSSAMTLLGKSDGASAQDGSSYLEIASFIKANGARPGSDLQELWKRIVFSMAVSNTDDHMRNHGFILENNGWVLSPLYDVNPDIYGNSLSLNVNDNNSELDYDLAVDAAMYYGVSEKDARAYVEGVKQTVSGNWKKIAERYGLSRGAMQRMEPAFALQL